MSLYKKKPLRFLKQNAESDSDHFIWRCFKIILAEYEKEHFSENEISISVYKFKMSDGRWFKPEYSKKHHKINQREN